MLPIKPQTYNEIIRFKKSLELKSYFPEITDEIFEKIYNFISVPGNLIVVSENILAFSQRNGGVTETFPITTPLNGNIYRVGMHLFNIQTPYHSSGSGDGGSGSNNNNNNNNNA